MGETLRPLDFRGPAFRAAELLHDDAGPVLGGMLPASGAGNIADLGFDWRVRMRGWDFLHILTLPGLRMSRKSVNHPSASLVGRALPPNSSMAPKGVISVVLDDAISN